VTDQHGTHLSDEDLHNLVESRQRAADGQADAASDGTSDAQRHADTCPRCGSRLQQLVAAELKLKRLAPVDRTSSSATCPPENKWALLAAGVSADAEAQDLVQHAAHCDHCGSLLRQIVQDFEAPTRQDEEEILSKLRSNGKEWQQELATRLRKSTRPLDSQAAISLKPRKPVFSFPRWAVASTVALIAATFVWWLVSTRSYSADRLLAKAYSEHRILAMRIPGAEFGPVKTVRGRGESHLERPPALLDAEAIIAAKLASSPDSAKWLQAKGRAELLEDNYSGAIESLRRAVDLQPGLPSLNIDLAAAYFRRGEAEGQATDFGNAIELLSRELAQHPDDKVALFNRAIVLERMAFYTQAIEDWDRYLRLDPQGEWSKEAHDRLTNVQKKVQSSKEKSGPLLSPTELARLVSSNELLATQIVDQRIEEYRELAAEEWLPGIFPIDPHVHSVNDDLRSALQFVSRISKLRHDDDWLRVLLDDPSTTQLAPAARAFRNASLAIKEGQYDVALKEAGLAEHLFQEIGNSAGIFGARYEKAFALQFSGRPRDCAKYAAKTSSLMASQTRLHYPLLHIQFKIETGICQNLAGDFGAARETLAAASRLAASSSYRLAYLRAMTMTATVLWSEGEEDAAWNMLVNGVGGCVAEGCPTMRAYSFYANMDEFAEDDGQAFLQTVAAQEAVETLHQDNDHLMRALEHNRLAKAAANAGLQQKAILNFEVARQLMASVSPSDFSKNYETEIAVNLAQLSAERGNSASALHDLMEVQARVLTNSDPYLKVDFYETLATLQMRSGDLDKAEDSLNRAAGIASQESCSLSSNREHLFWRKRSARTFRKLVEIDLRRQAPIEALERWEWYLAAAPCSAVDGRTGKRSSLVIDGNRAPPLSIPHQVVTALGDLRNVTFLSYAVLPDEIAIWVYDDRGVFSFNIPGVPSDLTHLANQFTRLCSNPSTDTGSLENVSQRLYNLLFAPIENHLDSSRILIIEGDDDVTGLPFQALQDRSGSYLADRYTFVYSSGLYGWAASRQNVDLRSGGRALVVGLSDGVSGGKDAQLHGLTSLPDVSEETQFVAHAFRSPVLLEGPAATLPNLEREIRSALVFHYAGHGLVTRQRVGLLLASSDGEATTFLDASELGPLLLGKTQLAVLSACATGGSDTSEGLSDPDSLARAFLDAGVPHVVASRWNVNSGVTLNLMEKFYGAIQRGTQVPAALAEAARAIRTAKATNHPYYWAAFSAFGKT